MLVLPVRKDKWLVLRIAGETVRLCIGEGEKASKVRVCVDALKNSVNVGIEPKSANIAAEGGA